MKSYEKLITSTVLSGSILVGLSGCELQGADLPEPTAMELFDYAETEVIRPGQAVVLTPNTDNETMRSLRNVTLERSRREHKLLEDPNAPTISGDSLARIRLEVELSGEGSDFIRNDAACDVINIDLSSVENPAGAYLLALSISDSTEDAVMVAWPNGPSGKIGETALLCVSDQEEPRHGVVLGVSDQPR